MSKLQSSLKAGITKSSIEDRKTRYGSNAKESIERVTFWALCKVVLEDIML
jgi:hypothetical protein